MVPGSDVVMIVKSRARPTFRSGTTFTVSPSAVTVYFLPAFNLVKVAIPCAFVFAERALVRVAYRVTRVLGLVVTVTARGAVGTAASGTLWSRAITTPVLLACVMVASDSAA